MEVQASTRLVIPPKKERSSKYRPLKPNTMPKHPPSIARVTSGGPNSLIAGQKSHKNTNKLSSSPTSSLYMLLPHAMTPAGQINGYYQCIQDLHPTVQTVQAPSETTRTSSISSGTIFVQKTQATITLAVKNPVEKPPTKKREPHTCLRSSVSHQSTSRHLYVTKSKPHGRQSVRAMNQQSR
ncbi:unnamed protein product [Cuscuta europaea]|uniref:Uncharacterized protein n=1 Tax=Cuscuta europaea TaxID=41803 RepID=A0A9P1EGP3_CUSEU|nr:unnamed protein product [Cuscuta europaea]